MTLQERLLALKKARAGSGRGDGGPAASARGTRPPRDAERRDVAPGADWERLDESVYTRRTRTPLDDASRATIDSIGSGSTSLFRGRGRLVFFDTETTGLSGGAGTVIFLGGCGEVLGDEFVVSQFFLADYPAEREFLRRITESFGENAVCVSYNGRSFDWPLLLGRCVMNGVQAPDVQHLDLLYPARRFWRSVIGACNLGSIEKHVLGITREHDTEGWEIPGLYFAFLADGRTDRLFDVFEHHRSDITTLARLAREMVDAMASRTEFDGINPVNLARFVAARAVSDAETRRAEQILRCSLDSAHDHRTRIDAGRELGHVLRRKCRYDAARDVWKHVFTEFGDPACGLELAKLLEHRFRRYEEALSVVERLRGLRCDSSLPTTGSAAPADLEKRRARIRRKIETSR